MDTCDQPARSRDLRPGRDRFCSMAPPSPADFLLRVGGGLGLKSVAQKIGRSNHQRAVVLESSGLAFGVRQALDLREQRAKPVPSRAVQPIDEEKVTQGVAGQTTIDGLSVLIALKQQGRRSGPETS